MSSHYLNCFVKEGNIGVLKPALTRHGAMIVSVTADGDNSTVVALFENKSPKAMSDAENAADKIANDSYWTEP